LFFFVLFRINHVIMSGVTLIGTITKTNQTKPNTTRQGRGHTKVFWCRQNFSESRCYNSYCRLQNVDTTNFPTLLYPTLP
jgi:hypothetical protein